MNGLLQLLRESLPEAIGGLIVAGVLGLAGLIWARRRKPPAPLPPTPPEPSLPVPRPPRRVVIRFIDRHDEQGRDIAELVIELLEGGHCINLWGSGGVGKTTLAVEATHRVFPTPFSGGIIWDTANGRADYDLVTLLDEILTALGREDARTLAPDAKADLVGHLLSQTMPCLLALDNFETIAREERRKILDFLAGVPCPILLTSRMRVPQAQNIRVGPMTAEEANQFLQSLIEQSTERAKLEKVDLEQIAEVAEYNPMLMRWVVAQLEQAMRPEDVFEDIARGRGEATERIFGRIFGRTFGLLGGDGQMALLALALFVPTASREALAAVCGFEDGRDRVNEAIRGLAAFDLLDIAVDHDRLGIVALTRRLTRAQLAKDKRTLLLVGQFVLHFVRYALDHPEVTKEDLDALDYERENLLAALGYAYAVKHWESVVTITDSIAFPGLLDIRGYWDEAIKWGKRAMEAARRVQNEKVLAGFAHNTATIYQDRGRYDEAKDLHNQSLEIKRNLADQAGIAKSLHQLGIIAHEQGHYQEAKDLYNQSLEIDKQLGNQAGIAKSLHNLGAVAQGQGNYQEAKDLYNQSLKTFEDLGAKRDQAVVLHSLGRIAQHESNYREAKRLYNQSLEINRSLGHQGGIAKSLGQLGNVAEVQGHYEKAKELYSQSLEIDKQLGNQAGIAKSLHNLGKIAQLEHKYEEAKDLYSQSLKIDKQLGRQVGIAKSLGQLGTLAEESGNVEEAAQLYRDALSIFERLGSPEAEIARELLARVTGEPTKE